MHPHVSTLGRNLLLLHIIVSKTKRLKFSIAVDFCTCALFKRVLKIYWIRADFTGLDSVGVHPADSRVSSNATRFDSVLPVGKPPYSK